MKTAIEKLNFVVGMKDSTSGPLGKFSSNMLHAKKIAMQGAKQMAGGIAGVAGSAYSLIKVTNAGREMNKALGDVKSVGASDKALKMLEASADKFASKYGGNSADIVRSGYDIQSSINGLKEQSLGAFTYSSSLLAKAGKSTSDITTKYTGVMFNIFEQQANKMGQSKWVDALTGKSAKAIEMFSTDANEMSAAFTNLGSSATIMGYDINSQMATIGLLQGTMGGANAGTALKAMVGKFSQAQKELNLSFKDSTGKMLPMHSVIEKIKNSVSNLDKDKQVAKLNKAFGEEGAKAVMNLFSKTDQLKTSVQQLSNIKNSSIAEKMALDRTDQLDKFSGKIKVLWKNISKGANTALKPILKYGSKILEKLNIYMEKHPNLAKAIGATTIGIIALTAGFSAFIAVMGFVKLIQSAIIVFKSLQLVTYLNTVATWAFNTALWANPITWVVGLIILLIAAIILCIVYWDEITVAVSEWWHNTVEGIDVVWCAIKDFGNMVVGWGSKVWQGIGWVFGKVKNSFLGIKDFGTSVVKGMVRWMLAKVEWLLAGLEKLPIVGDKIKAGLSNLRAFVAIDTEKSKVNATLSSDRASATGTKSDIAPGGSSQSFSSSNNSTTYVDSININSNNAPSSGQLEEYSLMGA